MKSICGGDFVSEECFKCRRLDACRKEYEKELAIIEEEAIKRLNYRTANKYKGGGICSRRTICTI